MSSQEPKNTCLALLKKVVALVGYMLPTLVTLSSVLFFQKRYEPAHEILVIIVLSLV